MSETTLFKVGDVVHLDGASAFVGEVTKVESYELDPLVGGENQSVTVAWRPVETTELAQDLVLERSHDGT